MKKNLKGMILRNKKKAICKVQLDLLVHTYDYGSHTRVFNYNHGCEAIQS